MSLLISIFFLVFLAQLVAWVGKTVLVDIAYGLYLRITRSPLAARQRALKTHILTTKAELMKTSAQDQFAKWAKLRRSVDKGLADLEKLNAEVASAKSGFSMKFNTVLWIMTTGSQFVVGWWFRKQPVFFLPEGWFGPLGWWLALPFAPAGSVSVGVWQMACKRVIVVCERVVKELLGEPSLRQLRIISLTAIVIIAPTSQEGEPEKVAMPGLAPTPNNTPRKEATKEKKEN
ncbi:CHD5-like protein-domain-containing protein [Crepidotus variabilis]|uniref:CHD5-like protein-domain-containing protein n=1 Tax=Crepidotus variabilis TaxID=179855 RepID=A0A9P6ECJ5_9AGAR|nr:CHD5-like protein-domain-containing protein [Crepidotus variabilis]